jgi:hypothetical protein
MAVAELAVQAVQVPDLPGEQEERQAVVMAIRAVHMVVAVQQEEMVMAESVPLAVFLLPTTLPSHLRLHLISHLPRQLAWLTALVLLAIMIRVSLMYLHLRALP